MFDQTAVSMGHGRVTGLSGNEIFCLNRMNMRPGNICIGNSVFSLGVMGGLRSGLKNLAGGEIPEITSLIHDGRTQAFNRMIAEAKRYGGSGVTGASSELIRHGSNIEFLSVGSTVHGGAASPVHGGAASAQEVVTFSTSADAQELYCQVNSGFRPVHFVFGNVAYSIGLGGNIGGAIKSLKRGEVDEYSQIFDQTRHLALSRITQEAKRFNANAVIGIKTTITPFMGAQEMLMLGTASHHDALTQYAGHPVTSDMSNEEMWNMVHLGYLPLSLVMGVSVYSLGLAGGVKAAFQSLGRGEIDTMTRLIYEAREKALDRIQRDAQRWNADEVVGVKTHVYDLGSGLIEFLAIGTAVKKFDAAATTNDHLPAQAVIRDRDTYFSGGAGVDLGPGTRRSAQATQKGPLTLVVSVIFAIFYILIKILAHSH